MDSPDQIKNAVSVDTVEVRHYPVLEVSIDEEPPFSVLMNAPLKPQQLRPSQLRYGLIIFFLNPLRVMVSLFQRLLEVPATTNLLMAQ